MKIGHKKDGRRKWPHRFHVSRPPLTRPMDPLLILLDLADLTDLEVGVRYLIKYTSSSKYQSSYITLPTKFKLSSFFKIAFYICQIWQISLS